MLKKELVNKRRKALKLCSLEQLKQGVVDLEQIKTRRYPTKAEQARLAELNAEIELRQNSVRYVLRAN